MPGGNRHRASLRVPTLASMSGAGGHPAPEIRLVIPLQRNAERDAAPFIGQAFKLDIESVSIGAGPCRPNATPECFRIWPFDYLVNVVARLFGLGSRGCDLRIGVD